jgi:DNA-binding transcriptional regulator YhcF (GntR family)
MQFIEKKNVYENIVAELKTLIENGVLRYGEKLPSVRAYALEKKVNPNTVAKAYSVLEQEGYIRVELKKGAYVSYGEEKAAPTSEVKQKLLAWKAAGISIAEIEIALKEVYGKGEEV